MPAVNSCLDKRWAGALRNRPETVAEHHATRSYVVGAGFYQLAAESSQRVSVLRDQGSTPSCVGYAMAAIIDAHNLCQLPWASGIGFWREGRRAQDDIEGVLDGTRPEYVIQSAIDRGWEPFREGEAFEPVGQNHESAEAMLAAFDRRLSGLNHYVIDPAGDDVIDKLVDALRRNHGVMICAGVTKVYEDFVGQSGEVDRVLGTDAMGADGDGHAQRIFGHKVVGGRHAFLIQNSWSNWGGAHTPEGLWIPQCAWVDENVVRASWSIDVLEVVSV
jgi:hypothetical protein